MLTHGLHPEKLIAKVENILLVAGRYPWLRVNSLLDPPKV
jgi:hypothetical protein